MSVGPIWRSANHDRRDRRAGRDQLLGHDQPVDRRPPAAAVLGRPRHADPARGRQLPGELLRVAVDPGVVVAAEPGDRVGGELRAPRPAAPAARGSSRSPSAGSLAPAHPPFRARDRASSVRRMAGRPPSNRPASARPGPGADPPGPAHDPHPSAHHAARGRRRTGSAAPAPATPSCTCRRPCRPTPTPRPDERSTDVDEWGRSEHMRALARRVYDPIYRSWFRVEWEGLEKIPTDGGALLVANHAGAIPSDAPAIMHGIETELERPVLRPGRPLLQEPAGRRHAVVPRRRRASPTPTTPTACSASSSSSCSCSPRARKGTGKTYNERYRLRRFGRGGFVEIAMRAGVPIVPDRRGRRRGVDADPVQGRRRSPRRSACPTSRSPPTCWRSARSARVGYFPAKFKLRVLDPVHFDVAARPGALLAEPDHGRVRAHPRSRSRRRSTTCCASASRSGSAEAARWAGASSSPASARSGAAASPRRSRPTPTSTSSSASTRDEPTVELERTEYVRSRRELLDPRPHREGHRRSTRSSTPSSSSTPRRCGRGRCTRSTSSAR